MKTFALYDNAGQPATGATVSFAYFGTRVGVPVSPPSIVEVGNGIYGFDETPFIPPVASMQTVYLLQTNKSPHWLSGALYDPSLPFAAVFFTKPDDTPYDGVGLPTIGVYKSFSGTNHTVPTLSRVSGSGAAQGLFSFEPSNTDLNEGRAYRVDAPNIGAQPAFLDGNFEVDLSAGSGNPTVSNFSPSAGAAIKVNDAISFDVTDTDAALRRVVVLISFPRLSIYEVAHDGDALGPRYSNVRCSRVSIANGYRYTLIHDEGWPSSPHIVPMAFDIGGSINAITSVTYAWTLVT